jgi:hypothetical protein
MSPKILLINPPVYDFAAYDFWLKPYGLLTVGGLLQGYAELSFFDYLDRLNPAVPEDKKLRSDQWGRGEFYSEILPKPAVFDLIPRRYRRFGLPRTIFQTWLKRQRPFNAALIQTTMTYWYLGVSEVIEDVRAISPQAKIVLGGAYATICPEHARLLGADLVIKGSDLEPLWEFMDINPDLGGLPLWQAYEKLETGVLKLTDGCPFKCSYCSVPQTYPRFAARPLQRVIAEFELLHNCGVKNIAFYDDALLFNAEDIVIPFLRYIIQKDAAVNFHTPNALHARFLNRKLAELMANAGFKTFYLGFENIRYDWQKNTGGKVLCEEFAQAVKNLRGAGVEPQHITAYVIVGHPHTTAADVESSMRFVNGLGIRIMLAEFSPIPDTPDGRLCAAFVDMNEPLWHSKTAFPIVSLGNDTMNYLKDLCRELNNRLLPKSP